MSQQWEYGILEVNWDNIGNIKSQYVLFSDSKGKIIRHDLGTSVGYLGVMGVLGNHGWELVYITTYPNGNRSYFKRQVTPGRAVDDVDLSGLKEA